jgi:hypothetical protein
MKIYDLLRMREEKSEDKKESKVYWDSVGVLIENDGKRSIKLNTVPVGNWDGWLTAKERQEKSASDSQK